MPFRKRSKGISLVPAYKRNEALTGDTQTAQSKNSRDREGLRKSDGKGRSCRAIDNWGVDDQAGIESCPRFYWGANDDRIRKGQILWDVKRA